MIKKTEITQGNGVNQIAISNSDNNQITIINNPKDHISYLIRNGEIQEAVDEFAKVYKQIGQLHPLHPLYTYKPVTLGSKIVLEHQPLNSEIAKKYPIKYRGRFSIIDKDIEVGETIDEFIRRKHIAQEEIAIDIKFIETWIGQKRIVDPLSFEQNAIQEGSWYILPDPPPPPIKAKLVFKGPEDKVIIDFLELRTTKISRKDNIGIISNDHQKKSPLLFSFTIKNLFKNELSTKKLDVNINIKIREGFERTVIAEIMYLTFMKYINISGKMSLVDLEKGADFLVAQTASETFHHDEKAIDERLLLLNDLRIIEDYFNVDFHIPDTIVDDDFRKIEILKAIIEEKEVVTGLKNFSATFNSIDGLEKLITDTRDRPIMVTADSSTRLNINIFSAIVPNINMSYKVEDIKVKNPEKIQKKIELFDEGDIIKVEFIPGKKNKLSTRYSINSSS